MTRGDVVFAGLVALAFALLVSFFVFLGYARARPPAHWDLLQVGDSIAEAQHKVPELAPDSKDADMHQWYHASHGLSRAGIDYSWQMDVTFDVNGHLTGIDGRSYNNVAGIFDSRVKR